MDSVFLFQTRRLRDFLLLLNRSHFLNMITFCDLINAFFKFKTLSIFSTIIKYREKALTYSIKTMFKIYRCAYLSLDKMYITNKRIRA